MERRTAYTLGALGAAVALVAIVFGRAPHAAATTRVPSDPNEVLERLPYAQGDARSREVAKLREVLSQDPKNLRAATRLARLDIQLSRERSDPRYLGHAQAALAPWWKADDAPVEVLVLQATIEQSLHDFESALADLDRAIAVEPSNLQALLTRAVVLTVRGRYDEARATCGRLHGAAPDLVVVVCETSIDGVTGGAKAAYERLGASVERLRGEESRDSEAWARSSLGELALRIGDWDAAEKHFKRTLAIDPDDAYVRGAYADLLIDRARFAEAIELTKGHEINDALLLRLAIAEKRASAKNADDDIATLAARFDASRLRGDVVHRREESRFELLRGDAPKALTLARANWDVQKEPWDVRVFVEAARAAKDRKAAEPVLSWLSASKLEDPIIAKAAADLR